MKPTISSILGMSAFCLITHVSAAQDKAAGYVDFGQIPPPGNGREFVEVNVRSNLIAMVARLAEKADPEAAQLLRGLQHVRVNVIGLNEESRPDIEKRIKAIRGDLAAKGWESVVTVQKDNEDISISLKTRGQEAIEGLVITVIHGNREAVLVNIVGNIRPEKVAAVGERLGIEPLKKLVPPAKN